MHAVGRVEKKKNQMYTLAMAVVEAKLKDSWTWFFKLLLQAIG